jgi:hypothetical protein
LPDKALCAAARCAFFFTLRRRPLRFLLHSLEERAS